MENKKFKFNVGDRVVCRQLCVPGINGKMGTVVAVGNFDGNEYLVEMDEACESLHDCLGFVPSGRGWMFFESMLSPVEETKAKKMTVAEVCKALGYDIEIVKE